MIRCRLCTCPCGSLIRRGVAGHALPVHAVVAEVDDVVDGVHRKVSVVICICAVYCQVPCTVGPSQVSLHFSVGWVQGGGVCHATTLLGTAIELDTKHIGFVYAGTCVSCRYLFTVIGLMDAVTSLVSTITSRMKRALTCFVISRLESDFMKTVSPEKNLSVQQYYFYINIYWLDLNEDSVEL